MSAKALSRLTLPDIGDSDIGSGVNMARWHASPLTMTAKKKHRTIIGDNAFVGRNTNLVAPVTVEANSYIGAGKALSLKKSLKTLWQSVVLNKKKYRRLG